jgi:comEA protein
MPGKRLIADKSSGRPKSAGREGECGMTGWTRNEKNVVIFLAGGLVLGTAAQWVESKFRPMPSTAVRFETPAIPPRDTTIAAPAKIRTVRINTASVRELNAIPGIGPVLAERIIGFRVERGAFSRIEDLAKVKGIGRKTLDKIRPYITVQ